MCDFIIAKPGVIDDISCKKIIDFFEQNKSEHAYNHGYGVGENVMANEIWLNNIHESPESKYVDAILYNYISSFVLSDVIPTITRVSYNDDCVFTDISITDTGYQIRKITGPTRLHADDIHPVIIANQPKVVVRIGTIVCCLSDSNDVLVFPIQKKRITLTKGMIIFFPPYWPYAHFSEYGGVENYRIQSWIATEKDAKIVNYA